jgi:uncharacterized repeat protein (TIGR01451 family)
MIRTRVVRFLLAPALLAGAIAVVLGTPTPASAQSDGISLALSCAGSTFTGTPLLCGGLVAQNAVASDTVTITGVYNQVNSESGPVESGNILASLHLTTSGGAVCTNRQTSCTIPYGGFISSTPSDAGAYIVQPADYSLPGQVLSDQVTVDWLDCTPGGPSGCLSGEQTTSTSSSTTVQWSDWSGPVGSDNSTPENLISVSCVSTSFCMGVDRGGDAVTYNGSAWSARSLVFAGFPGYFGAELRQVSCVSTTFCVASDDDGSVFIYNGVSWSPPDPVTNSPFNMGVSCASTTFCVAIGEDGGGTGYVYNGSTWTQKTVDTNPNSGFTGVESVSCALGTDFCAGIDNMGSAVVTTDGGAIWTSSSIDGNPQPTASVSCATATYCLAVDNYGDAFTFNGGSWSSAQDIDGTKDLTSVSCTTGSNPIICYAVDNEGDFLNDSGGSWHGGLLDTLGGLNSISCVAPGTFCALVDSSGNEIVFTYDVIDQTANFTFGFDGGPTSLNAVACPSTTDCGGVDSLGDAGFSNGVSTFDVGKFDPGRSLNTLSCGSASFCVAADSAGGYLMYNGTWTLKQTADDGVTSVSCAPGTTFCAAVTDDGGADENPGPPSGVWSGDVTIDGSNALLSVSCATASFCAATDNQGNALTYNGASWSGPHDIDGSTPLTSVSCATANFCVATDEDGYVLTTSNGGGTWSAPELVDHDAELTSVSCASTMFCAAVDEFGDALTYNGSSWTTPSDIDESNLLTSVSCTPGSSFCAAVDNDGNALVYEAPSLSVTKTADAPTVTVGATIGFTVTATNSSAAGTGTAAGITLSDPLPAGTGIDWSVSPAYSGPGTCSVTGAVGSQALGCTITTLAAGASASVHVSSATTSGSTGTYNNTATVSAVNAPSAGALASIQVTPSITSVIFGGTVSSPTVTVEGSGFGTEADLGTPHPAGVCGANTGSDYSSDPLYLFDSTGSWHAGRGPGDPGTYLDEGDCIGLLISSYSNTQISFALGNYYPCCGYSLSPGDAFAVGVLGATFSGTVAYGVVPLVITTTASMIPLATQGVAYSYQLQATGGVGPYAWSVTSGALAAGLTLSPSGLISGTPDYSSVDVPNSFPGTYDFTVTAEDSSALTASQPLNVTLIQAGGGGGGPPPPPPPVACTGSSCSVTSPTSTGTVEVTGTSVGTGIVDLSVSTATLDCSGLDYSTQVIDVVSTTTFPTGLKVISIIEHGSDPKAYVTCYSDPTAFVDAAGDTVTTGFLPTCPATITGPCVVSQLRKKGNVVVTLHILDGDPRFWTGKAGKTGKK